MNYKLIFEAPNLPGGIIFTMVVPPPCDEYMAKTIADQSGLRFKDWDLTDEEPSPLRFAPERFSLDWLVKSVTEARPVSHNERKAVIEAIIAEKPAR